MNLIDKLLWLAALLGCALLVIIAGICVLSAIEATIKHFKK